MNMQKFYNEATDHLRILIDHAHEEQDNLTSARKVLDAEADAVRTEIGMMRNVLGKETGCYGHGPIYPPRSGITQPYTMSPPAEPMVFAEEDTAKMEARLADLGNKYDELNVKQQDNFNARRDLDGIIEDLSKARAFLTAPTTMFIQFYEDRNPAGSY